MQKSSDPYEILGVSPAATIEIIKLTYKKRMLETHPDRVGGSNEEFDEVVKAYEMILKDHDRTVKKVRFEQVRKKKERMSNLKAAGLFGGIGVSLLLVIAIFLH